MLLIAINYLVTRQPGKPDFSNQTRKTFSLVKRFNAKKSMISYQKYSMLSIGKIYHHTLEKCNSSPDQSIIQLKKNPLIYTMNNSLFHTRNNSLFCTRRIYYFIPDMIHYSTRERSFILHQKTPLFYTRKKILFHSKSNESFLARKVQYFTP